MPTNARLRVRQRALAHGVVAVLSLAPMIAAAHEPARRAHVSPAVDAALRAPHDAQSGVAVIVTLRSAGRQTAAGSARNRSLRRVLLDTLPHASARETAAFEHVPALALRIDARALESLRAHPDVLAITPDHRVRLALGQANALTQVAQAHGAGITGAGRTVAIIDTGVDSSAGVVHAGLADDLVGQRCFRSENDCIGGPGSAEDEHGHGTHVAGIVTGPQGVAPDANFLALKVFTTGDTSDSNILAALDHVIGRNAVTPGQVHLVNMSLAGDPYLDEASCNLDNAAYLAAFDALREQGVSVFVATGNQGRIDAVTSPACVSGAIGVGAVDDAVFGPILLFNCSEDAQPDQIACYSNATPVQGAGELVDLMAPGCLIQSLGLNGAPAVVRCGTSMATPHAAGVAMLAGQYLAAHGIAAPPPRLEEFLEANAQDVIDLRITGQPVYPRVSVDRVMDALTLGVPGGLTATASAPTSVSLQWNAVAGADGYVVHRIGEHEAALPIGSTVAPSTGFIDAAPGCGMQRYVVTARRAGLESVASQPVAYVAIECPFDGFSDGFER